MNSRMVIDMWTRERRLGAQDDAGHTSFHFAREGSHKQAVGWSERYADLQSSDPARYQFNRKTPWKIWIISEVPRMSVQICARWWCDISPNKNGQWFSSHASSRKNLWIESDHTARFILNVMMQTRGLRYRRGILGYAPRNDARCVQFRQHVSSYVRRVRKIFATSDWL